jgi:hypothetical protein
LFRFEPPAGLALSALALGLSGLFGRSLSAYLASGACCFCGAWPADDRRPPLGIVEGGPEATLASTRAIFCAFFLHHPFAPQIWSPMRGSGAVVTFVDWGVWVPLYGVGAWLVRRGWGSHGVRGLRREVY